MRGTVIEVELESAVALETPEIASQKENAALKKAFAQKVRKCKFANVRKANLKNAFA